MISTLIIAVLFFQGILLQVVMAASSSSSGQTFRTNPYDILNIDSNCSNQEIKQSYRKLCLLESPNTLFVCLYLTVFANLTYVWY